MRVRIEEGMSLPTTDAIIFKYIYTNAIRCLEVDIPDKHGVEVWVSWSGVCAGTDNRLNHLNQQVEVG